MCSAFLFAVCIFREQVAGLYWRFGGLGTAKVHSPLSLGNLKALRFFTAVFGENYLRAGLALARTFNRYNRIPLTVFTDQLGSFDNEESAEFRELVAEYPPFYREFGQRNNVFKYSLIRRMQTMYPGETIGWLDADMLVFADLTQHAADSQINVISHGRRKDIVNCGGGLKVPGQSYAVGGLFAVPPGPALDVLQEITQERPQWHDDGSPNHTSGDQLILNHLVNRTDLPVHWITDNHRYIYNLEVADNKHPVYGDPALARIRWIRRPVLDGRPIVVFYWIKKQFDRHLETNFESFRPSVARRLMQLYRG